MLIGKPVSPLSGTTVRALRSRSFACPVLAATKQQKSYLGTTKTTKTPTYISKTSPASLTTRKPKPLKKLGWRGFGFTKDNELFVGRMAMVGFAASLIGEVVSGKGALAQFGYEVFDNRLGILQIDALVVGSIGLMAILAILPASGTFIPDPELEARPPGPLQKPLPIFDKRFWGVQGGFGFTKENELFVGRVAQLGFAASLIGETLTGKGALAQFGFETGISMRNTEIGIIAFILFLLFAAINPGSGKFVTDEE